MASRKLLVDRISFMDKNLMFFLLFSFVQRSVGQQSGECKLSSIASGSVTIVFMNTSVLLASVCNYNLACSSSW